MTPLRSMIAAATLAALGSAAAAQDFTQMDLSGMYDAYVADTNAGWNAQVQDMVWQNMNNPQVQAMYQQMYYNGQFAGSFEEFAYQYSATAGFTPGGIQRARDLNAEIQRQTAGQIQYMQQSPQGYYDAYGNWVNGYYQNSADMRAMW